MFVIMLDPYTLIKVHFVKLLSLTWSVNVSYYFPSFLCYFKIHFCLLMTD